MWNEFYDFVFDNRNITVLSDNFTQTFTFLIGEDHSLWGPKHYEVIILSDNVVCIISDDDILM